MDLFIFTRDAPRHPWQLAKKVALPKQEVPKPVSYRTRAGADGAAEVWMIEAASEQQARRQLEQDTGSGTNRSAPPS